MAELTSEVLQATEVYHHLVNNMETEIDITLEKTNIIPWSKSLEGLPLFTIKEIEFYRLKSGKGKNAIIKTRDRGRKFFEEKYITSGDTFTRTSKNTITFKGKCKASMKAETRSMNVVISLKSSKVIKGHCNCPAGKSGYCNHVMALLFQVADYSLHQTKCIPEEVSCTSQKRQWGVPTDNQKYALPVLSTKIRGEKKKGVSSTLYDPRLNQNKNEILQESQIKNLQLKLSKKDNRIGFAHVIDMMSTLSLEKKSTKYGEFYAGSTLSHHLAVFDADFEINSCFPPSHSVSYDSELLDDVDLPTSKIPETSDCFPTDWGVLTYSEMMTLEYIFPETLEASQKLERKTVGQDKNEFWMTERSKRITSSNAHKIYIRKKNFETLAATMKNGSRNHLPKFVEKAMQHGKDYENVAKQKFFDYLTYILKRNIVIRETGLVVQPYLFWLGASPDGLLIGADKPSLIEIKCPYTKRHTTPKQLLKDEKFYIYENNGVTFLKRKHQYGYFSQVQLAMGLSQIDHCYFIVYTFKGLIITSVVFEEEYFIDMVIKLNSFYRKYILQ